MRRKRAGTPARSAQLKIEVLDMVRWSAERGFAHQLRGRQLAPKSVFMKATERRRTNMHLSRTSTWSSQSLAARVR